MTNLGLVVNGVCTGTLLFAHAQEMVGKKVCVRLILCALFYIEKIKICHI